ncbi:unnamed protein product [Nippostrongylus brasiliensis]|uniref:Regulator of chromosome condensation (inferred by orthology to a C. elegans protein) n=1 Tax=Nippostrongylus brasiliensis TaxID=27835 RepID=A0A158QZ77_NIPBR|nr:unnamed protein product [Nippostrongylus brasiliensis]
MDFFHSESKDPSAGDVPTQTAFEKQESFTSEPSVDSSTEQQDSQNAPMETPSELPEAAVETAETIDKNLADSSENDAKSTNATETMEKQPESDPTVEEKRPETVESVTEVQSSEDMKEVPSADGSSETAPESESTKDVEMKNEEQGDEEMDTAEEKEEGTDTPPSTPSEQVEPKTPKTRGRKPKAVASEPPKTEPTSGRRGRKRKVVEESELATPAKTPKTPGGRGKVLQFCIFDSYEVCVPSVIPHPFAASGRTAHVKVKLSYVDYAPSQVGDRVLSCGEGEQLGHPGRTTTKKPRKVDIVEDDGLQIVQVVAGGVHSALLTADGDVYMCGINEQGTVPALGVEPEGSTDKFSKVEFSPEIKSQGKIVMLAAGASFTAGLTDKGSVVAWGNLRDTSGEINVHPLLAKMKDHPVVLIHHKKRVIVKIAAGENHLVMLEDDGKVLTFGDGKMGQLGRSKRTGSIRPQYMVDEDGRSLILILQDKKRKDIPIKVASLVVLQDIHAGGFWTMLISDDQVFSFGLNNFEHLGIPIKGDPPADGWLLVFIVKPESTRVVWEMGNLEIHLIRGLLILFYVNHLRVTLDKRELRILTPSVASAYLGQTWTHMDGVQHIIARNSDGEVYGIGKNTDNALGLGTWTGNDDADHWKYSTLERIQFPDEAGKIAGTTAKLGCSLAWTESGDAYAWGCDTSGQLGLGLKDDDEKIVPKPQKITSAHLDGFKIISASISDNHCLFLASKV